MWEAQTGLRLGQICWTCQVKLASGAMRKTVLIREQYQADQHWMEVAHLIAVADAIIAFLQE